MSRLHNSETPEENSSQVLLSGSIINAALTFLSRILGMLRDVATAALFGISASVVFDAFVLAFRIPNLFRRLFGEGAISISFLPAFCRQWSKNQDSAWELLTATVTMLSAILGALTLVGVGSCLGYIFFFPGERLATHLILIMMPYLFLICQTAIFASALQGLKSWLAPALAPIIMNLLWLWAVVVVAPQIGDARAQAYLLASIVSLSAALQLILQIAALRKYGYWFQRCLFNRMMGYWRRATSGWIIMATGLALLQVCVISDSIVAWYSCPVGTVSSVFLAERLFEFPLGLIGISVATTIYPILNIHAAEKNLAAVKKDMSEALHLTLYWGLPATAGLFLISVPLCQLLYEHGATTPDDTMRIGNVLAIYSIGVWAYCLSPIITRGFYSLGEIRTPAFIVFIASIINLVVNIILALTLSPQSLQYALALSTVICFTISTLLLGALWIRLLHKKQESGMYVIEAPKNGSASNKRERSKARRRKKETPPPAHFSKFYQIICIVFSTAIMTIAGQKTLISFPQEASTSAYLIKTVVTVSVCTVVYLSLMYFLGTPNQKSAS